MVVSCALDPAKLEPRDEVRLFFVLVLCLSLYCFSWVLWWYWFAYTGFLLRCIIWPSGLKRATHWTRGCSSTASYSVLWYLYIYKAFHKCELSLHLRKDIPLKGLKWPGVRHLRCFLMIILLRCVNALIIIIFPFSLNLLWCSLLIRIRFWHWSPFFCCYSSI